MRRGAVLLIALLILSACSLQPSADELRLSYGDPPGGRDAEGNPLYADLTALVIDPRDSNILYLATRYGGIYKTIDGAGTWNSLTGRKTGLPNSAFSSLAIDPLNPSTIYAGSETDGLFKSTNAGRRWNPSDKGMKSYHVSALAIDPINTRTVYAGRNDGSVYRTINGGFSWTRFRVARQLTMIMALAVDPREQNTIYAATGGGAESTAFGILRSTDWGETWFQINLGFRTPEFVLCLAVEPGNPGVIYAGGDTGVILKGSDGGSDWRRIDLGPNPNRSSIQAIAIDPENSNNIYAGHGNILYNYGGLLKSTDQGVSWTADTSGLPDAFVSAIVIDPLRPSTIYIATAQGVFKSMDGGKNWKHSSVGLPNRGRTTTGWR